MNGTDENEMSLFETGLYTVGEVSRLTHVRSRRVSRWMRGYSYPAAGRKESIGPIWNPETPRADGTVTMGFNDMLEIRFVNALREHKISLKKIRQAVSELRVMLGARYPFSSKTVFVLGKELITKLHDEDGKELFVELSGSRQTLFYSTTLPELERGIIFEDGFARKWYPYPDKYPAVVVNPRVMFGAPVIEGTRLSTEFIYDAFQAEGSYKDVAYWYGIETSAIKQAVSFHRQYAA